MPIHSTASIHPDATVHSSCEIGPHVVIDGPVVIGPHCRLGPSVVVLGHTEFGAGSSVHSHAVIGDVPQDCKYSGGISHCWIGEGVVIREGVTVHRASGEQQATIVGPGCHLMSNSHVAHDCVLEERVTLVSGALLGGHVQVGRGAIISGNTGVHQFVRIGELAMIRGVSMISQDIPPFVMTDPHGAVAGLNSVGLTRAGISSEERQEIKTILKLVYRSGMSLNRALALAKELAITDAGRRFVQFFGETSRRGIRKLA